MAILIRNTTPWLDRVSDAARVEWQKLCDQIPNEDDLRRGSVAFSEPEIEWMYSKFKRFHEIVRAHHSDLRSVPALQVDSAMPRPAAGQTVRLAQSSPSARA